MKIGILTYHRAFNCGAMLQAWATVTFLRKHGYEAVLPDCNTVGECHFFPTTSNLSVYRKVRRILGWGLLNLKFLGGYFLTILRFRAFLNTHLKHAKCDNLNDFDALIVGSDQVWNPAIAQKYLSVFLGEHVSLQTQMIGYGLSGGDDNIVPDDLNRIRVAAKRFFALGFREKDFRDLVGVGGVLVVDPTLLLSMSEYEKIAYPKKLVRGEYLFVYCVSDSDEVLRPMRDLAKKLRVELVVADVYRCGIFKKGLPASTAFAMSPDRFLAYMRDAKYVVVSSFHGCVFSILYRKQFVCLYSEEKRAKGRQYELMADAGLLDKRLPATSSLESVYEAITRSYQIRSTMEEKKRFSSEWLLDTLQKSV